MARGPCFEKGGANFTPPGGALPAQREFNVKYPNAQSQDRIYLPYRMEWEMLRTSGYVANIRYGSTCMDAPRPASSQAVIKLMWPDSTSGRPAHVFARTTAYSSAFAHRLISPCRCAHIALGDIVDGVLEIPSSEQCSANLLSWDIPELAMLVRNHGPLAPE